jgi:hypothetical protein
LGVYQRAPLGVLRTQGAFIKDSQSWCRFNGIKGLSSTLVRKTCKIPQEESVIKKDG